MVAKSQRLFSLSFIIISGLCLMFSVLFLVSDIVTLGFSQDSIASVVSTIFFGLMVSLGWYLSRDTKSAKNWSLVLSWGAFGFFTIFFLLLTIVFLSAFSIGDESAGDIVIAIFTILPVSFLLFLFYFYVIYSFYKDDSNERSALRDFFMALGAFFGVFVLLIFLTTLFPEENEGKGERDDVEVEDEVSEVELEVYPLELDEEIEELEELEEKEEESVVLSEMFALLPEEYCDSSWRTPVLIYDEENYFMKTGPDVTKGGAYPSYSYCEFTVFKNLIGGKDIYGVVYNTLTPMLPFSALWFFEYEDGVFVDSAASVTSLVDFGELCEAGQISIEENKPDLADQDLGCSYYAELPQYGTTIKFYQYNTGEVIYELKWDGAEFSVL